MMELMYLEKRVAIMISRNEKKSRPRFFSSKSKLNRLALFEWM